LPSVLAGSREIRTSAEPDALPCSARLSTATPTGCHSQISQTRRIFEDADVFDFEISQEDMQLLDGLMKTWEHAEPRPTRLERR
jgi:hypothetical protein